MPVSIEVAHADIVGQVDTGQVVEAEGTHGMTGAVYTGLVDIFVRGHAHFEHPEGFFLNDAENTVQNKAIHFLLDENGYFVDLQAEVHHALCRFIRNMGSLNNFNQLHDEGRVEEVEVAYLGGTIGGIGNSGAHDKGAVGGQNGVGRSNLVQIGKNFPLQVDSFQNGFDDHIGIFLRLLSDRR